ncbi:hypothetical protein N7468_008520 [Penicillium chermesinum]|uniref:Uncharacterized protein n=1 Tax=Penicillium chermesinum TaxID=63820 RepID=A0A9W9NQD7_9EURO|nr:uncharacterized protein N7468_008520 [Penicillium chermesinum]KAJ5223978.1 hypothetical protein N7468_008520 [Penicillium chermesinum]
MDRIMDAIRADHLDLQSYYNRIVHAGSSAEGQNIFTWELARHVGEELVRYPVLPKHLHEDTAEDRRQHQSMSSMKKWVDLIKLEDTNSAEESGRLATSFGRTKYCVPTRAHPHVPTQALYQIAIVVDHSSLDYPTDLFRKWPASEDIQHEPSGTVYNMPQLTEELEKVRGVKDERIESTNYKQSLESDKLLDPCLELDLEDPKIAPFTKAYEQLGRFIPF